MLRNIFTGVKTYSWLSLNTINPQITRNISTELAAALRPFYFVVHPDLFGQHPQQRSVNEDSLKQLSAHLQLLHEHKFPFTRESKILRFYIREENSEDRNTFKLIQITLDNQARDPKTIITKLLELCNLSTEYVKSIKSTPIPETSNGFSGAGAGGMSGAAGFRPGQDYKYGSEFAGFEYSYNRVSYERRKKISLKC